MRGHGPSSKARRAAVSARAASAGPPSATSASTESSCQSGVVMAVGDAEVVAEVSGDGPVDAVFKAIERMAGSHAQMQLYSVNAITGGTDAQGEVTVRLERDGRIVNGLGADTDIIVASAKAYINALNRLHGGVRRLNPQLAA